MTAGGSTPNDDQALRLLNRSMLVFAVAGFVLFALPRAFTGLTSGDAHRVVTAVYSLAFWSWLTWRLTLLLRDNDRERDSGYWFTSAAGYGALFVAFLTIQVVRWLQEGFDARVLPFGVIVLVLFVASAAAGRKVASRTP